MPLYDYECPQGHQFEASQKLDDRHTAVCGECGDKANLVILSNPMLDPRMGVDPGFPTAAARWAARRWKRAMGIEKDSNNNRFGAKLDTERDAYNLRKLRES
jgi:putative FmdB family regulatory protein